MFHRGPGGYRCPFLIVFSATSTGDNNGPEHSSPAHLSLLITFLWRGDVGTGILLSFISLSSTRPQFMLIKQGRRIPALRNHLWEHLLVIFLYFYAHAFRNTVTNLLVDVAPVFECTL